MLRLLYSAGSPSGGTLLFELRKCLLYWFFPKNKCFFNLQRKAVLPLPNGCFLHLFLQKVCFFDFSTNKVCYFTSPQTITELCSPQTTAAVYFFPVNSFFLISPQRTTVFYFSPDNIWFVFLYCYKMAVHLYLPRQLLFLIFSSPRFVFRQRLFFIYLKKTSAFLFLLKQRLVLIL